MRVLVVDDHEFVRRGICALLADDPSLTICAQAADGKEAVEKAEASRPDVVVMDISMPKMNGLEATREIKRLLPETEIIIVSQHGAAEMYRQAVSAGARAYVVKSSLASDLLKAIASASKRENFVAGVEPDGENPSLDSQEILQRSTAFERALRQSEERFRSAMNNMAEGLYTVDNEGLVTYINPAAEAMFGWGPAELLGKKMHDVTHYKHPDGTTFPAANCPGLQVLQKGAVLREHEDTFIRKDGTFFPVVFSASPLRAHGSVLGVVVSFRDDTQRRASEDALRRTTAHFRLVTDTMAVAVTRCSRDLRFLWVSARYASWIGRPAEEIIGYPIVEILGDEAFEKLRPWFEQVLEGEPTTYEEQVTFKGIGTRWINATYEPTFDSQGIPDGWVASIVDSTERRRAEQALRESEERLRTLANDLEKQVRARTQELEQRNAEVLQQSEQLRDLSIRLLQTQSDERRHIARELHDSAGQLISALSMNLARIMPHVSTAPTLGGIVDDSQNLVQQLTREIRTAAYLLHPPLLDDSGLPGAIRWYTRGLAERGNLRIDLVISDDFGRLPQEMELAVFRIIQECLTNVHRHSGSVTAAVRVFRTPDNVAVEVQDDGTGMSAEKLNGTHLQRSGVGIMGMRERVRSFNGTLDIHSNGKGTRVSVTLPISADVVAVETESQAPELAG